MEIDGHIYTVEDRFGGGYTNKIDIYFDNYLDAINFGRQKGAMKCGKADGITASGTKATQDSMRQAQEYFRFRVQLDTEGKIGKNWSDCH